MKEFTSFRVECSTHGYCEVFFSKRHAKKRYKQLSKQHPHLKFNLIRITKFY